MPVDLGEWVAEATTGADQKGACQVGSCRSPDTIAVSFDDEHLVADAGLILAATLAEGLLLRELFDEGVDPGDAPGGANVGEKAMTLVHPALAGATWIGDADWLRAGATGEVLGHRVAASSTLGTFLRSFTWGTARQLDQVAGEALTRAWRPGRAPAPGRSPSTSTPPIARPTGSPSRARRRSAGTAPAATTRLWPAWPAPLMCCIHGCARA